MSRRRFRLRWALAVFLIALIFRFIFLLEFQSVPLAQTPTMDMEYHHQWATAIAEGREFIDGAFFRAPLYPTFLGIIYTVFGDGFWAVRIIQALMGSLTAALVFLIGLRIFGRKEAVIAGLIVATSATLIFYDGQLLAPSLAILLNTIAIYFLLRAYDSKYTADFAVAGLALGLSVIVRPTVILFAVIIGLWIIYSWRQSRTTSLFRPLVAFACAVIIPIVPVTVHNYVESGEFVLIGTYSGMNAYIGNNLQSDGISAKIPGARNDWWGMMEDARLIAENDVGHSLSDAGLSDYWLGRTVDETISNPGHFLKHLGRKLLILIQGIELSNNFDLYYFAHQSLLLKTLMWPKGLFFPWGILFPLAVVGMVAAMRWRDGVQIPGLFLLASIPAIVLFFVTSRYRQPLIPALALFASFAVTHVIAMVRSRPWRKYVSYIALFVLTVIVANLDVFGHATGSKAQGYFTMASLYARAGNSSEAEKFYRLSIGSDPTFAQAYNDLAQHLSAHGDHEQATETMEKAVELEPDNFIMQYNLGAMRLRTGDPASAIEPLVRTLELRPDYPAALNNLGLTYQRLGNIDSALVCYYRLVMVEPAFPDACFNLAFCYQNSTSQNASGLDSALHYFYRAVELDDSNAEAYYNLGMLWKGRQRPDSAVVNFDRFLRHWRGDPEYSDYVTRLIDSLGN